MDRQITTKSIKQTVKFLLKGHDDLLQRFNLSDLDVSREKGALRISFWGNKRHIDIWLYPLESSLPYFRKTSLFKISYRLKEGTQEFTLRFITEFLQRIQTRESLLGKKIYKVFFRPSMDDNKSQLKVFRDEIVELRITLKCNEKCPFCNTIIDEHTNPENIVLDSAQIRLRILEAKRLGASKIAFTGGEPTLIKELPYWVKFAKSVGLSVGIQTNGVIPSRLSYWQRFEALPDNVSISFHTTRPERVGLLTGVPGTFDKKIATLKLLKQLKIPFAVNFVITTLNQDEIELLPDFLYNLLGTGYGITYSFVAPTGRARHNLYLIPKISDIVESLQNAIIRAEQLGIPVMIPENCGFPRCILPKYFHVFEATKYRKAIKDIPEDHIKFSDCNKCIFNNTCIGMWNVYVERYGDTEFRPVKK